MPPLPPNEEEKDGAGTTAKRRFWEVDDRGVVAAGVTVGINAAAMGTSHLIDRGSRATAYSALSMTIFGAVTVAVTVIPGVKEALLSAGLD